MTHSNSHLSALVLSSDNHAVTTCVKTLESHGFSVSKTDSTKVAGELCRGKRFDVAIYDQDNSETPDLPEGSAVFSTPHVVLGLVTPDRIKHARGKRIHFTVQKPFTSDFFSKTLKAAYGSIASSRRLSSRHQVCIPAITSSVAHRGEKRSLEAVTIVNVSHTGMCLQATEMLPQEGSIQLRFVLPSCQTIVQAAGTVIWAHGSGRAGIKLSALTPDSQAPFNDWLESMSRSADELLPPLIPANRPRQWHPNGAPLRVDPRQQMACSL
jgi:PilZ domain